MQLLKEVTPVMLEYVVLANIIAGKNHYIIQKIFKSKTIFIGNLELY